MHRNVLEVKNKFLMMAILILIILIMPSTVNAVVNSLPNDVDGIITLEDDVVLSESFTVESEKELTINLNGHTLSAKEKVIDVKGAELTITGKGIIRETEPNFAPIFVTGDNEEKTVINIGKDVTLDGWSGIMISSNAAKSKGITVNVDGKINTESDSNGVTGGGVYVNGNVRDEDIVNINLSSTVKIDSVGNGIHAAGYANWRIDGSVIDGVETGIGAKAGTFDINNATITCTGVDDRPTEGYGNGINPSGAAIQIESNDGYAGNIKMDIDGGRYESKNGVAFYEYLAIEKDENGKIIKETIETKLISLNITNGKFISYESKPVFEVSNDFAKKTTKFITGGSFTCDVSDYVLDGYYVGKQENGTYLVKQIVDISNGLVTGISDKTYTGKELTQEIVVTIDETTLKNDVDYTISYENNKVIGTATVTIVGKGYYKGTITKEFKINPISIAKGEVSGILNKTYNGKGLTQEIIVTLNGKTLVKDTDYTVSYSNNTKPGKAKVVIVGTGIYEGTITETFLITPKKLTELKVSDKTTSKITLSWKKHEGVTGYKVYSYNYSKKEWEYVDKTEKLSYTIKSLKPGTTYKYRVRAYKNIDGTQYFGSYATSVKTATMPKTPTVKAKAGDKKITLTWNKISGASGYRIYMSTSKNGEYKRIKTISNNKTFKYTKSGLKTNKKYYFKVRAYKKVDDEKVYSSYTKVISATTKKVYTVKKGNTLYSIAKKYKTTVEKLVKINKLKKPTLIKIGLRLLLN